MTWQMSPKLYQSPATLLILLLILTTRNTGATLVTPVTMTTMQVYSNRPHVAKEGKIRYAVLLHLAVVAYISEEAFPAVWNCGKYSDGLTCTERLQS